MNKSKLSPYRLPISIFAFFIAYTLLSHTFLSVLPTFTSTLIGGYYSAFDITKETEQVALIYSILLGVFAYFFVGKLMNIDVQDNMKSLMKGLGVIVLIIAAYGYNLVQQA